MIARAGARRHAKDWWWLVLALGTCAAPRHARAQCSPITTLGSDVPVTTGTVDQTFQFTQTNAYWTAVGVRANSSTADWDLYMYTSTVGYPFCLTGLLASSTTGAGTADVIVGDFNSNPAGTYYPVAHHYSSDAVSATVEWDDGPDIMPVNGPTPLLTMPGTAVVRCWDVYLTQGEAYHFTFFTGSDLKLLLFRNPANSAYWTGRGGAELEMAGSSTGYDYTAPATDWYGLVLVNDGGADAYYVLGVGTCSPIGTLASRVPVNDPAAMSYWQFTPASGMWTAVATRPSDPVAGEQDLAVYSTGSGASAPTCFTGWQAEATYSGATNVVAGQPDPNTPGTWYASSNYPFAGSGPSGASTEWDGAGRVVLVDDPFPVQASMGTADLLDCWNVYLEAGKSYNLNINWSNNFYITYHMFENPGGAPYWTGYGGQMTLSNNVISPQVTGWHALVIAHERLDSGTYTVSVTRCETPTALANDVPVTTPDPTGYYQFTQNDEYWTAVGVHALSASSDWDLGAYGSPSGSAAPVCFSNLLASSTAAGYTDFVVGDFNLGGDAFGTYYVRPYRFGGESDAATEWDGGADLVTVGDPFTHVDLTDTDFLRCWDVLLSPGQTYTLIFDHDPSVNAHAFLFQSNNAPYWSNRANATLQTSSTTTFTVPATDYYGLVVADDGGSGGVDLRILPGNVGVPGPDAPRVTALRDAGPNPSHGPLALAFDLAAPADVGFDVLDVAGRVVCSRPPERMDAGSWTRAWDAFGGGGRGPGIYFLRMRADGREIGERKLVRID